jgi:hypothetical protein
MLMASVVLANVEGSASLKNKNKLAFSPNNSLTVL